LYDDVTTAVKLKKFLILLQYWRNFRAPSFLQGMWLWPRPWSPESKWDQRWC